MSMLLKLDFQCYPDQVSIFFSSDIFVLIGRGPVVRVYKLEKPEVSQVPMYYICSKGFESKEEISVKSDFELINITCCNFTL